MDVDFFRREDAYQLNLISSDYFLEEYFLTNENYKKQLTKIFIDIVDINESQEATELKGRSLPSPSVRSFMSFILQHQNLVANKHALFYRFDEKRKKGNRLLPIPKSSLVLSIRNIIYFLKRKPS